MAQQSTIMKPGLSYSLSLANNASGSQTLSPGCRYVRVTASAAVKYGVGNSAQTFTALQGIYAPGQTFGPDYLDVEGTPIISGSAVLGTAAVLYITEMSA